VDEPVMPDVDAHVAAAVEDEYVAREQCAEPHGTADARKEVTRVRELDADPPERPGDKTGAVEARGGRAATVVVRNAALLEGGVNDLTCEQLRVCAQAEVVRMPRARPHRAGGPAVCARRGSRSLRNDGKRGAKQDTGHQEGDEQRASRAAGRGMHREEYRKAAPKPVSPIRAVRIGRLHGPGARDDGCPLNRS
jgi:hypothetical protein